MQSLSDRVENVAQSVDVVQSSVNGVHRKMTDVERMTMMKLQNFSKTEKLMLRMLNKLQNEVDIMKEDIGYIKACWIDSAQRDSPDEYERGHHDEDETDGTDLDVVEEDIEEERGQRERRRGGGSGKGSRGRRKSKERGKSSRTGHREREVEVEEEEENSASYITDSRSY